MRIFTKLSGSFEIFTLGSDNSDRKRNVDNFLEIFLKIFQKII